MKPVLLVIFHQIDSRLFDTPCILDFESPMKLPFVLKDS